MTKCVKGSIKDIAECSESQSEVRNTASPGDGGYGFTEKAPFILALEG